MAVKSIIKTIATLAVIGGVGAGGWYLYKHNIKPGSASSSKVYVQKVSVINTVNSADLFANDYMGVIEAQKSVDVKYDQTKTVDEVLVKEGDKVKKGDKLLTYDVEELQIKIDEAQLEVETMQNNITINENEIKQYEEEKRKAPADEQAYIAAQILQLQSDNARTEYDIKTKNVEITKLQSSLENAYVTAPASGTVKDLKEPGSSTNDTMYSMYGGSGDSADVIMKITADGNFRVKGTINEQNVKDIAKDTPVFIKSRKDDTQWHGVIDEIDTAPQQNDQNMYEMMYGDGGDNKSSKYAFYVKPDSLDGLMLGQHVLIEIDNGQEEKKEKEGIWLYSDFILKDGTKNFVWAKDKNDKIEKRYVEIGDIDDDYGDTQIVSGLETDDYIAYPSDYIEEGMKTTTNQSDKDIPKNDLGDEGDMMGMDGEMGMMEGDMGDMDMPEVSYDDDGNMVMTDEDGNTITSYKDGTTKIVSPDGGVIEMDNMGNFTKGSINMETGEYQFEYEDGEGGDADTDKTDEDKANDTEETVSEDNSPDLTFEDIYGISEDEFSAMTPQEQDEFLKKHYENG